MHANRVFRRAMVISYTIPTLGSGNITMFTSTTMGIGLTFNTFSAS